jgi:MoxR-like ATPase
VAVSASPTEAQALVQNCARACLRLKQQVARVVVGQSAIVDGLLVALLARGHALLVGVPGLAKTLLVSSIAECLGLEFGRVQFTPDLLPADITGTDVINEVDRGGRIERQLSFLAGPIFKNLVLADEINRTPPKTQAALLQAMQERCVTIGGRTHTLPVPFQVFATRNPIEQEGTYPLPEAQLDRFLLELHVDYPSEAEELRIARETTSGVRAKLEQTMTREELQACSDAVPLMPVTDEAVALAVGLARASRPGPQSSERVRDYVRYGAGPRGSQALLLAAKATALIRGEAAADVDDVLAVSGPALRHRLVLSYRAEADGVTREEVLRELIDRERSRLKV